MSMNGYIQNTTNVYKYAFKMHIAPGQKIALDDLYKIYGEKHGIEEGLEFAEWLRNIKLRDTKTWSVIFEGINFMLNNEKPEDNKRIKVEGKILTTSDEPIDLPKPKTTKRTRVLTQGPVQRKKVMTDDDILNLKIGPSTKKELDKIKDVKVLKYALNKAKHMPDKAVLMKLIKDRLNDLQYQF